MSDLANSDKDSCNGAVPDDSVISQVQVIIAQSTHAHYTNRPDLVLGGGLKSMPDWTKP